MQIEGSFTCVLFIATLIRTALVSLEHCHGFPNVDFATPGAVSQGLHLADVTVIEVLDSIDFWELIISILSCDFNLLEQVLVLNEKVVKFTIVLLGWIIFRHFHVLNTFSWGFLFNFYVLIYLSSIRKISRSSKGQSHSPRNCSRSKSLQIFQVRCHLGQAIQVSFLGTI